MTKNELESLAQEITPFILASPHCSRCGKDRTQMCGRCFGNIRHKLPLTPEQHLKIRDIEYEARRQIHKKQLLINFYSFIWGILFFFSIIFVTEKEFFLSPYIPKAESTFSLVLIFILHVLSYVIFLGAFCQMLTLMLRKKQLKYQRTIEDENYYGC